MKPPGCGDCTACCTALAVADVNKPAGVPCPNLIDHVQLLMVRPGPFRAAGCDAYDERPASCRAFECEWLKGNVGAGELVHRPDKSGALFVRQQLGFGEALVAFEAWPGAFNHMPAQILITVVRDTQLVAVKQPGSNDLDLGGPAELVEAAAAKIAAAYERTEVTAALPNLIDKLEKGGVDS